MVELCSIPECSAVVRCKNLCRRHYMYLRQTGRSTPLKNTGMGIDQEERFWSKVDIRGEDDCWEYQGYTPTGSYGRAQLTVQGVRLQRAHCVAYYFTHRLLPTLYVLHSCDNKRCCNPKHLREGTPKENSQDAIRNHRLPYGEKHRNAKLTEAKVLEIRQLSDSGISGVAIAAMFGVSTFPIYSILRNQTWKHVT